MISITDLNKERKSKTPLLQLYDRLLETVQTCQDEEEDLHQIITRCKYLIQNFFDLLFFRQKYRSISSNEDYLLKDVGQDLFYRDESVFFYGAK